MMMPSLPLIEVVAIAFFSRRQALFPLLVGPPPAVAAIVLLLRLVICSVNLVIQLINLNASFADGPVLYDKWL